jgi:hypothetical protein
MATKSNETGTVFETVDPTYKAGRASIWSQDSLGAYRVAAFSGLTTVLAANAEVFQFRWTDATNIAVLKFLKVRVAVITGFTAAQELAFDAILAASWSADGSGGTTITPGATNLLKRSSYPQSKVGAMRISTTGALTAGTKTLYGNALQDAAIEETLDMTNSGDDPAIFGQNEGLVVRNIIAMGAAGTVRWAVQMAWAEFLAADYPSL